MSENALPDVMVSLRRLFVQDRLRVFLNATRLDPYHAREVEAWGRVVAAMRPDDHIVWMTFWHADERYFEQAAAWYAATPVPPSRVWVLGNTEQEVAAARRAGFRASWVNHNAWLDDRVLRPQPVAKTSRAILVSQLAPYKRVHLAAKVQDLVVAPASLFRLHREVDTAMLSGARFVWELPEGGIAALLGSSRVGLILSVEEGACFASSEYLLCGIPVVSTPSRGGRDVFYTRDNSWLVAPDPDEVERGVARMIARAPDPWVLHEAHVAMSRVFRARFCDEVLGAMFRENGCTADPQAVLEQVYCNKLVGFVPERDALALVNG